MKKRSQGSRLPLKTRRIAFLVDPEVDKDLRAAAAAAGLTLTDYVVKGHQLQKAGAVPREEYDSALRHKDFAFKFHKQEIASKDRELAAKEAQIAGLREQLELGKEAAADLRKMVEILKGMVATLERERAAGLEREARLARQIAALGERR